MESINSKSGLDGLLMDISAIKYRQSPLSRGPSMQNGSCSCQSVCSCGGCSVRCRSNNVHSCGMLPSEAEQNQANDAEIDQLLMLVQSVGLPF
jgi:hypothetical protein